MTENHIVALASAWIGTPYRHQASLKGVGCDCLGLLRGVWRELHGAEPEALPAYSPDWAESGLKEDLAAAGKRYLTAIDIADFGPGDVLLFRWKLHLPAKHAGLAISRTRMIHAQDGASVQEVPLTPWWHKRIAFAFRFPESTL